MLQNSLLAMLFFVWMTFENLHSIGFLTSEWIIAVFMEYYCVDDNGIYRKRFNIYFSNCHLRITSQASQL